MNKRGGLEGLKYVSNAFTGAFVLAITSLLIYLIVGGPVLIKIYGAIWGLGEPWQTIVWVFVGILLLAIMLRRR